jgi:hypothetical protein
MLSHILETYGFSFGRWPVLFGDLVLICRFIISTTIVLGRSPRIDLKSIFGPKTWVHSSYSITVDGPKVACWSWKFGSMAIVDGLRVFTLTGIPYRLVWGFILKSSVVMSTICTGNIVSKTLSHHRVFPRLVFGATVVTIPILWGSFTILTAWFIWMMHVWEALWRRSGGFWDNFGLTESSWVVESADSFQQQIKYPLGNRMINMHYLIHSNTLLHLKMRSAKNKNKNVPALVGTLFALLRGGVERLQLRQSAGQVNQVSLVNWFNVQLGWSKETTQRAPRLR